MSAEDYVGRNFHPMSSSVRDRYDVRGVEAVGCYTGFALMKSTLKQDLIEMAKG